MDEMEKLELEKYRKQAREHSRKNAERVRLSFDRISLNVDKGRGDIIKRAARAAGASVNAYIGGLIDDDLRRRGLLDDSGASAPTGGAARPVDDNRAEDSGGGDGAEVQPMERADASRVDGGAVDDSAGRSSAYRRHIEAGHTMRKEAGIWVWSDGERVDFEDLDDSHKLEQAIAIRRADMRTPAPAPMPSASWDDDDLPFK